MEYPRIRCCGSAVLFTALLIALGGSANASQSIDPLAVVRRSFPQSIAIRADRERLIEFCPDNTCDAFVASKDVPLAALKDFTYLYIYFFSDYYILDKWRTREESGVLARQILSKSVYRTRCGKEGGDATARCVLQYLARHGRIRLYAVRYDEKQRNSVPVDLNEALARARIRKPN